MAIEVQVSGACAVYVAYPYIASPYNSGNPILLGYTRNGLTPQEQGYYLNVPGDQNGGEEGPPIEIQALGMTALIRLELTKYDMDVVHYVRRQLAGVTQGTPAAAGSLMFSAGLVGRLTLVPLAGGTGIGIPQNFPRVFTRQPIECGRGSKFSTLICEFEAHKDASGVLWNSSTTGI